MLGSAIAMVAAAALAQTQVEFYAANCPYTVFGTADQSSPSIRYEMLFAVDWQYYHLSGFDFEGYQYDVTFAEYAPTFGIDGYHFTTVHHITPVRGQRGRESEAHYWLSGNCSSGEYVASGDIYTSPCETTDAWKVTCTGSSSVRSMNENALIADRNLLYSQDRLSKANSDVAPLVALPGEILTRSEMLDSLRSASATAMMRGRHLNMANPTKIQDALLDRGCEVIATQASGTADVSASGGPVKTRAKNQLYACADGLTLTVQQIVLGERSSVQPLEGVSSVDIGRGRRAVFTHLKSEEGETFSTVASVIDGRTVLVVTAVKEGGAPGGFVLDALKAAF